MSADIKNVSRRNFVRRSAGLTAGVLVLGVFSDETTNSVIPMAVADQQKTFSPNVFLSIDADGLVTIICARSEMGQGVRTSLPAIIADELNADWQRVNVVQGIGDEKYGSQNTDGSTSVRVQYPLMRQAGAAAREMLEKAAAISWKVPTSQCKARNHAVHHAKSGRSLSFGELSKTAAGLKVPKKPTLKSPKDFVYIGKSLPNVDNRDFVTGNAVYGIDTHIEGMMYASIERSPVMGGTVSFFDASDAWEMPGVKHIVELEATPLPAKFNAIGGVAVIADNTWTAENARKRLKIKWNEGHHSGYNSVPYRRDIEAKARQTGKAVRSEGDVDMALATANKVVSASYYVPHLSHAPMEPPCCLAVVREGRCEVWAPTQAPQIARNTLSEVLGIDKANITVNVTLLGGGFGRKSKPDFIVEAALLSRKVKAPIKLTWTREDDIRHDYYHSNCAQYLAAGFDSDNRATAWLHRAVFPSIGATFNTGELFGSEFEMSGITHLPYDIANIRCENGSAEGHVRIGWLRSVHNINQAFAVNSFMGEMAVTVGKNQKDCLLELIGKPRRIDMGKMQNKEHPFDTARLRHVVEVVADNASWGKKFNGRRAMGIAAHYSFYTYVAQVADVSVDDSGNVTVHAVHCAVDCGTVVNPDRVTAQMEGAIIYGLSNAMHGSVTVSNGRIEQSNFHDYPVLRLNQTPDIHVYIIDSQAAPSGVGEPGTPPTSPAVTNAIFNATGVRLRELPIDRKQLAL